jgi:hypothetical protein
MRNVKSLSCWFAVVVGGSVLALTMLVPSAIADDHSMSASACHPQGTNDKFRVPLGLENTGTRAQVLCSILRDKPTILTGLSAFELHLSLEDAVDFDTGKGLDPNDPNAVVDCTLQSRDKLGVNIIKSSRKTVDIHTSQDIDAIVLSWGSTDVNASAKNGRYELVCTSPQNGIFFSYWYNERE